MDVGGALELLGGVASRRQLISLTCRADLENALIAGDIVRLARGRYAASSVDVARLAAHRLSGVIYLKSAALQHGWAVKSAPALPQICVPRNRKLASAQRAGIDLRRADLCADEVRDGVTSRDRTLVDCGRHLATDEGLAIFDSALRDGFPPPRLAALARDARGPGAAQIGSSPAARTAGQRIGSSRRCARSRTTYRG